ncbi:type VI secretion system ImpM family protein [Bradyrhizobium diazoefficiens]
MTMRCGLFGKIGAKRDFIAIATPRSFLEAWEPWVQAALSASRHQLGPGWQQAFLTAPVWRFWLGAAICGTTVAGAIMPSLDGVGRYYPLTLHAVTGEAVSLPPPSIDPQDEWFGQVEAFLLSTLDRAATFEQISDGLDRLAVPRLQRDHRQRSADHVAWYCGNGEGFGGRRLRGGVCSTLRRQPTGLRRG